MNIYYFYLFLAIIFGYIGNISAKKSKGFTIISYVLLSIMAIALCMYCLSKVFNEFPFGFTYITYAVSLILLTMFSGILFYKEKMNMYKIFGTILIIVGIIIIHTIGNK